MKVIFLDIDGVLNTCKTAERWRGLVGIDAVIAGRFARLQEEVGASVVLSSTWRLSRNWKSTMRKNGEASLTERQICQDARAEKRLRHGSLRIRK
jgi:hypothetical protein